jgi:hypothetical protein
MTPRGASDSVGNLQRNSGAGFPRAALASAWLTIRPYDRAVGSDTRSDAGSSGRSVVCAARGDVAVLAPQNPAGYAAGSPRRGHGLHGEGAFHVKRISVQHQRWAKPVYDYQESRSVYLPNLINYVVPVIQERKNKGAQIGSGVLVGAEGRHFIATAGHCIDAVDARVRAVRSSKPLRPHPAPNTPSRDLETLDRGWHDTLDLGYLVIADPECPELRWDQLCDRQIAEGLVHFVGYPKRPPAGGQDSIGEDHGCLSRRRGLRDDHDRGYRGRDERCPFTVDLRV